MSSPNLTSGGSIELTRPLRHRLGKLALPAILIGLAALAVALPSDAMSTRDARLTTSARLAARTAHGGYAASLRQVISDTYDRGWGDGRSGGVGDMKGNRKGLSVAVSGNTAVVAVPGLKDTGAAYIYERSGTKWHKAATLFDPRDAADDEYAWAVAISSSKAGTYVAIGGNDTNKKRDFVYVYEGSGRTWRRQARIGDPGSSYLDMFGDSLAISSKTLVIGASCENNNTGDGYIWVHILNKWVRQAAIANPINKPGTSFGQSVAVSGNTVLISEAGIVYVYTHKGSHWPQTNVIFNPGARSDDFGFSVSLDRTTAVIGSPESLSGIGQVYIYVFNGQFWIQRQLLSIPFGIFGGEFGWSVDISGSEMAIGMPEYAANGCGTAFDYTLSGGKWKAKRRVRNPDCSKGAGFGWSVSVSAASGAYGAPGTNNNHGAAYMIPLP